MSVLIVDDNRNFARFLRSALVTRGHSCRAVGTMEEARRAAAENPFDIFLVDLRLPDGDGRKLISHLIEDRGVAPRQIVLMTAMHRDQIGDTRVLSTHPVFFKPFRLTWLLEELRSMTGTKLNPVS